MPTDVIHNFWARPAALFIHCVLFVGAEARRRMRSRKGKGVSPSDLVIWALEAVQARWVGFQVFVKYTYREWLIVSARASLASRSLLRAQICLGGLS